MNVVQMSMAENEGGEGGSEEKMDVDDKDQDYSEVGHILLIIGFGVSRQLSDEKADGYLIVYSRS